MPSRYGKDRLRGNGKKVRAMVARSVRFRPLLRMLKGAGMKGGDTTLLLDLELRQCGV
jgi:hypothetical protein